MRVDGKKYAVNTDFRHWIRLELAINDDNMPNQDKIKLLLSLYKNKLPPRLDKAVFALGQFYSGGGKSMPRRGDSKNTALYSFEYDKEAIYAAFYKEYNIDLNTARLHWWQFKALFQNLPPSCTFMRILCFRAVDLSRIKDSTERSFYRRMKVLCSLPDSRSKEEKDLENTQSLSALF